MKKKLQLLILTLTAFSFIAKAQELVKDANPGHDGSEIENITAVEDGVFYIADDGTHGYELWKSDGTEAGTYLVKDINPGVENIMNFDFAAVEIVAKGNTVYFAASDGVNGIELWKSDGTAAGTVMIKDIHPTSNGYPQRFFLFNDIIFFSATDGASGRELWKTDGTEAGTVMVKNIFSGTGNAFSTYPEFVVMNDELYFIAKDGTEGLQIWKTDGTEAGTVTVTDLTIPNSTTILGGLPQDLTVIDDQIYFTNVDSVSGLGQARELWKTDGTQAGTSIIKDINPNGNSNPRSMKEYKGELYFRADDGIDGYELWKTDGTETGTVMVKLIRPGGDGVFSGNFEVFNNELYFIARTDTTGVEIWKTDGTEAGTVEFSDTWGTGSGLPNSLMAVGNSLFFNAYDGIDGNNAQELWRTDGTWANTELTKNIYEKPNGINKIYFRTVVGPNMFFTAIDTAHGMELWKIKVFTYGTITENVCDSYTIGGVTYDSTGVYEFTMPNAATYDSVITINLTVAEAVLTQSGTTLTANTSDSYQWFLDGIAISGETNQTLEITTIGDYTVEIVDGACTKMSEVLSVSSIGVGVNDIDLKNEIRLFPNPTNGKLSIQTEIEIESIQLVDVSGRVLLSQKDSQIDLSGYSRGIYLVKVNTVNHSISFKVIKE
jgi:ELWxxDGT repeat protein